MVERGVAGRRVLAERAVGRERPRTAGTSASGREHVLVDERREVRGRVERERRAREVHADPARRRRGVELDDVVRVPRADDEQRADEHRDDAAPAVPQHPDDRDRREREGVELVRAVGEDERRGEHAVGDAGRDPVRSAPSAPPPTPSRSRARRSAARRSRTRRRGTGRGRPRRRRRRPRGSTPRRTPSSSSTPAVATATTTAQSDHRRRRRLGLHGVRQLEQEPGREVEEGRLAVEVRRGSRRGRGAAGVDGQQLPVVSSERRGAQVRRADAQPRAPTASDVEPCGGDAHDRRARSRR